MRASNLEFRTDVLPFVVATAGEFVALYYWLVFLDAGHFVLGNVILWTGFAVERTSVFLWIRRIRRQKEGSVDGQPLLWTIGGLFLITLSEILIWILWLAIADGQIGWLPLTATAAVVVAAVVLMILMLAQHSVEMAALKNKKPFAYVGDPRTIFFTLMEVGGAVAWLYFMRDGQPVLGGICLLVGLSIEHVLQGSQLKPDSSVSEQAQVASA
jgi:hypothetical protein